MSEATGLGWGQTMSTFKNFVIFKNGIKWRVVFGREGFSHYLYPHLKSHLFLLAEVEVKGSTKACKTWMTECCDWKTSFLTTAFHGFYLFKIVFPNENLASSIRRLEGVECRRICLSMGMVGSRAGRLSCSTESHHYCHRGCNPTKVMLRR